jgi:tetratricopeptide (TPR) repeat protein
MGHQSTRTSSSRQGSRSFDFQGTVPRRASSFQATDVCFGLTFLLTTICFAGRASSGQLVMVVGAGLTAGCWALRQLMSREPRYTWTGTEWLWLLGIAIGIAQVVPLSREWMLAISPQMSQILMPAGSKGSLDLGLESWNQLSLAPWESVSGLATFVAYAMLFIVLVQRLRRLSDVERTILAVGAIVVLMAVFADVQCLASNGKFYWVYEHPFMTTDHTPHGSFTNHNHLSQFLALGVGPLIWGILRGRRNSGLNRSHSDQETGRQRYWVTVLMMLGLGCSLVTVLLTSSRGGLLAVAVSTAVCIAGLLWLRVIPAELCVGLVVVSCVVGGVVNLTGSETAMENKLKQVSGREQVWQANIAVAKDFPYLGTGVGTHNDAHRLRLERPFDGLEFTHAESSYLQVLSETGLIGLGLAGLFILVSLWWCLGAFFNADKQISSLAVAILASLMANLTHAVGDFFWYTPSCMLLLAMQLACACRLYQLTRESSGRSPWIWQVPRLLCVPALGGVLALLAWMTFIKLPAAVAEPEQMRYIALSFAEPSLGNDEVDHQESRHEMWLAASKAAKLNPHNSRLLETAALNCLELFNDRQEQTENSIPLSQLRDAIKASEFESPAAMREWLDRAVGKNLKLLQIARRYFRQSLRESPLRAQAYLQLAELSFLDGTDAETETAYLKQALVLRSHDPAILFAVGRHVSLDGDTDAAMPYWREAFELSPMTRHRITELLVPLVSAEFFLANLKPEWSSLRTVAQAFDAAGRQEEGLQIWQKLIDESSTSVKAAKTRTEREQALIAIYDAYVALKENDKAIKLLIKAHQQNPASIPIRTQLAWGLYRTERYTEAAEHLVWLSSRNPADKSLQNAASKATKERMRTAGVTDPNS